MFNLLPETEKEKILREYNHRRLIVFLAFMSATVCMALVALFPSFVLSSIKLDELETDIVVVRQSKEFQEADKLQTVLTESNEKLTALQLGHSKVLTQDIIAQIINAKNSGIRMNGLLYKKSVAVDTNSQFLINGIAQNRESLSRFVTDLQKIKMFKEVTLPVSSFTKDINAEFTINIVGEF